MAENSEAMKRALQNPLILQTIFRKLSLSDLLDCRLVNSFIWFELATEVLCEKKESKIDFNFSNNLSSGKYFTEFLKGGFSPAIEIPTENPWSLKSLVNCIKESRSRFHVFPCSRFRFSQVYFDDVDEDLLEFFSIHGELITELEIDLMARTNPTKAIGKFGEILWKQLVNLEKLTIWSVSLPWTPFTHLFPKPVRPTVKLKRLKLFRFEKSLVSRKFKFIEDIQNAAPKLEKQHVQEISFVPPKTKERSNVLEHFCRGGLRLTFSPETSNIRFYERLVKTKAKFTNIVVDLEKVRKDPEVRILPRVTKILTDILNLSQSTLREMDGVMAILSLPEIQLKSFRFPLCHTFTMTTEFRSPSYPEENETPDDENSSTLNVDLKPTWEISQSFPSLSQVYFPSLDFIQNCEDSIRTVKMVSSGAVFSTPGDFQKLAKIFPKTQELELYYIRNFQECASALWGNFGRLTTLKIGILVENPKDVSMDTAFLGMGRTSSILELSELKILVLTFTPVPQKIESGAASETGNGKWSNWKFLEKSTLIHIRQELKQLNGICWIVEARKTDHSEAGEIHKHLEELKPFASIQVYATYNQRYKSTQT